MPTSKGYEKGLPEEFLDDDEALYKAKGKFRKQFSNSDVKKAM